MVITVDELITRARKQAGTGTKYGLGGGKTTGIDPRDERGSCDCSAYICWCLDIRKHQPSLAWLIPVNGGWYNTDGIWWDATKEQTGHFEAIAKPAPGAIIVFPGRGLNKDGPKIGHVGIVTKVAANGALDVLHCSSGNFRNTGDAIRETKAEVFKQSATVLAWAANVLRQ
jgi:hypothetical protein